MLNGSCVRRGSISEGGDRASSQAGGACNPNRLGASCVAAREQRRRPGDIGASAAAEHDSPSVPPACPRRTAPRLEAPAVSTSIEGIWCRRRLREGCRAGLCGASAVQMLVSFWSSRGRCARVPGPKCAYAHSRRWIFDALACGPRRDRRPAHLSVSQPVPGFRPSSCTIFHRNLAASRRTRNNMGVSDTQNVIGVGTRFTPPC